MHFSFNNLDAKNDGIFAQTVHFGISNNDLHGNLDSGKIGNGAGRIGNGAGKIGNGAGFGMLCLYTWVKAGTTSCFLHEHGLGTGVKTIGGDTSGVCTGDELQPQILSLSKNAYCKRNEIKDQSVNNLHWIRTWVQI